MPFLLRVEYPLNLSQPCLVELDVKCTLYELRSSMLWSLGIEDELLIQIARCPRQVSGKANFPKVLAIIQRHSTVCYCVLFVRCPRFAPVMNPMLPGFSAKTELLWLMLRTLSSALTMRIRWTALQRFCALGWQRVKGRCIKLKTAGIFHAKIYMRDTVPVEQRAVTLPADFFLFYHRRHRLFILVSKMLLWSLDFIFFLILANPTVGS